MKIGGTRVWMAALALAVAGSAQAANGVFLRGEDGHLLDKSKYIWFTDQRVALPVSAYEKMGISVTRDKKNRRVRMTVPHTGAVYVMAVNQRTLEDPLPGNETNIRFERPVLLYRHGDFYVAAMALKDYFRSLIDTRWDPRTRTVTLQRTHEMQRLLNLAGEPPQATETRP